MVLSDLHLKNSKVHFTKRQVVDVLDDMVRAVWAHLQVGDRDSTAKIRSVEAKQDMVRCMNRLDVIAAVNHVFFQKEGFNGNPNPKPLTPNR